MSRTTNQYLDSVEYINNIIGMAVHEGTLDERKAVQMTDDEKRDWYEKLTDQTEEVLL